MILVFNMKLGAMVMLLRSLKSIQKEWVTFFEILFYYM